MTAYLTRTEFLDQTIPGEAFTGLTSSQIDDALTWASSIADGYLDKRYSLPLIEPYPTAIKSIVGDIAQLALMSRRCFRPNSGNEEIAQTRRDNAMKMLLDISRGDASLAGAIDSTPDLDEEGPLASSENKTSFSMTTGRRDNGQRDL